MKTLLPMLLITFLCVSGFSGSKKKTISDSKKKTTCFYLIYYGSGDQESLSNYLITQTPQAACVGSDVLCWIRICTPYSYITQAEFDDAFEALDEVWDWYDELDDDPEKTVTIGQYEYRLEKEVD